MTIILTHYFLKSLGPLRIISKCKLIHDPRGHDQPYCIGALSTFLISMKLVYKLYGSPIASMDEYAARHYCTEKQRRVQSTPDPDNC